MKHMELLKKLSTSGIRVFSTREIISIAGDLGISSSYLSTLLRRLTKQGFIRKLYKGTFVLSNDVLAGSPLHEFEIAHHLINPSAICCWSAMAYHGLTDQVLRTIFVMSPYGQTIQSSSKYIYTIENTHYVIVRVKPSLYFGIEDKFMAEIPFSITNIERTLIDGLVRPQYSGGFLEVLEAFNIAHDKINPQKIIEYASKFGVSTQKRLGWVFETIGIFSQESLALQKIPCTNYYPIDVSKPNEGVLLGEWNLRKNF
jgi:predicted transcriptional regulator of viral defense system